MKSGARPLTLTDEYHYLVAALVGARRQAGLSQRAVAKALGKSQSHVCKIEQGERRVEALEFYRIAAFCGQDPARLYAAIAARWAEIEMFGLTASRPSAVPSSAPPAGDINEIVA
jgi:transcriptional regulator with XRE-family HTH domain